MKPGDRVRWAESHCRLEDLKGFTRGIIYAHLRSQQGIVVDRLHVGGRELLDVSWENPFAWPLGTHTVPAELLERAEA